MAYDLARLRVLVVDDNKYMRKLLTSSLKALSVVMIDEATSGEEALGLIQSNPPDLVIADWLMEPMDGIEMTRRIRSDAASPNPYIPVIMVSGFGEKHRVLQARDAGVTEFLVKPFTAKGLSQRIAQVIDNPRAFVRTYGYFGPDRRRKMTVDYDGPERRAAAKAAADKAAAEKLAAGAGAQSTAAHAKSLAEAGARVRALVDRYSKN